MIPWLFWSFWFLIFGMIGMRLITILLDIRDLLRSLNIRVLLNGSKGDPDDPAPAFEVRRGI